MRRSSRAVAARRLLALLLVAVASHAVVAASARSLSAAPSSPSFAAPTAAAAADRSADPSFDPTRLGPCSSAVASTTLTLDPSESGCKGAGCKLNVTITVPVVGGAGAGDVEAPPPPTRCMRPLPVVLVLPGFTARAFMYAPYVEVLASQGYAAVSYEAPLLASFPPLKDAYESSPAFVARVVEAARAAAAASLGSAVALDPRSAAQPMAVGHSRGGKIAALALANGALSTAALLDPVDGGFGPLFPPKPSAVEALRASPPAAGALVVQAGVQGLCNGAIVGGDSLFWNALVAGGTSSWRTVLPKAGHGSLAALGAFQPVAGLVCGGKVKFGGLPEKKAVQIARTVAIEWIERHWEGVVGGGEAPIPAEAAFCGFVAREAAFMTPVEQGPDGRPVCAAAAA